MSPRVLISAPYFLPVLEQYRPALTAAGIEAVPASVVERLSERDLMKYAGQVDGVLCGDDRFSAEVLSSFAPRLKVISKWGTGVDSIDRATAERLGIAVRNTPDAFTEAVADSVLGYILAFARRGPWMDREMKAGRWRKQEGTALHESALGVVGVGRIGKAVLRRAQAFGMRLLGHDIVAIDPAFVREVSVDMVSLADLAAGADFLSVNCDLNPTSRHLIDARLLARMKTSAVVINTARGAVIDEPALIAALQSGKIAGAALDVFEDEPLPAASPLRRMDHVLLAPHNANCSPGAWEYVHRSTLRNLFDGLGLSLPPGWEERPAGARGRSGQGNGGT